MPLVLPPDSLNVAGVRYKYKDLQGSATRECATWGARQVSGEAADTVIWAGSATLEVARLQVPRQATGSVQARLVVLATAAILPMLLLFSAIAYVDYRAERVRSGERQLSVTHSMAATVERELRAATASLQALALSPNLQQDDIAGFRSLAERFVSTEPKGSALVLLDSGGQQLLNTAKPPGGSLIRREHAVNAALTWRVFDTAQPVISDLFPRETGNELIVTADVPVVKNGHVIYDLSLVLPAARFSDILSEQSLPAGRILAVFDSMGQTVARLPNPETLPGLQAADSLLPALLTREEGVLASVTREGTPVLTAFSHTKPSGWAVAFAVPDSDLRAPLQKSLQLALGLGVVGMLASAVVAFAMGQRILRPIRSLTRFAADPAHADMGRLGLRELDAVAAALRQGEQDRQGAMHALQTLNEQLEGRVREETASRLSVQAQLAQSQRMEALGQLAGGIAHDFNNVLQAVTGGLSLIQRRAADESAVRRLTAMAAEAAARGASITGRLLTFARRGELAAAPVPPEALLEGLRMMLAHTLGPGITIRVEVPYGVPNLLADKPQLETALINIAINARDAMPDGGTLTLTASVAPSETPPPPTLAAGAYVHLTLSDTGSGMAPEILARASEPFFTTKEPGQGTGLGLAMARGFAEQSRGAFAITSIQGQGTTIHLWFPQAQGEQPAVVAPQSSAALPATDASTAMRVLMVDDDGMVREVLAGEMEAHGFIVTTAADGPAALALLDAGQVTDLLITDYAMAGMTGLALITETRQRRPGLPALLLTGFAESRAEEALASAQDRLTVLLRKPIAGEDLARHAARLRRRK